MPRGFLNIASSDYARAIGERLCSASYNIYIFNQVRPSPLFKILSHTSFAQQIDRLGKDEDIASG